MSAPSSLGMCVPANRRPGRLTLAADPIRAHIPDRRGL